MLDLGTVPMGVLVEGRLRLAPPWLGASSSLMGTGSTTSLFSRASWLEEGLPWKNKNKNKDKDQG